LKENLALKKLSTGGEIAISTPKQRQKAMLAVIDTVAGDLGNTRTVCRSSYIHPTLLADWENEKFAEKWEAAGKNRKIAGLDRDESSTLYYLSDDA
jgi:DNA topoisomerase-1